MDVPINYIDTKQVRFKYFLSNFFFRGKAGHSESTVTYDADFFPPPSLNICFGGWLGEIRQCARTEYAPEENFNRTRQLGAAALIKLIVMIYDIWRGRRV